MLSSQYLVCLSLRQFRRIHSHHFLRFYLNAILSNAIKLITIILLLIVEQSMSFHFLLPLLIVKRELIAKNALSRAQMLE